MAAPDSPLPTPMKVECAIDYQQWSSYLLATNNYRNMDRSPTITLGIPKVIAKVFMECSSLATSKP